MKNNFPGLLAITFFMFIVLAAMPLPASGLADEYFDYQSLELEFLLENRFSIEQTSSRAYVDEVKLELSWFPRDDYRQFVDFVRTRPLADFGNNGESLVFEWQNPEQDEYSISVHSELMASGDPKKITQKLDFPVNDLDAEHAYYLQPGEIIDINPEIQTLAGAVVGDEDDLFKAVFEIASWVNDHVEYNLSSLTADASQKSSWVLENRQGVCDEITSLFISMCRSVGIPARFVSGLSYSNTLQNQDWGPHGWAEVYFPGFGWVPVDVTYKEIGFVDATHIKLRTSLDAKGNSIDYWSRGVDSRIVPDRIEHSVDVLRTGPERGTLVNIDMRVVEEEVGEGSYNLVVAEIRNPHNYYIGTRLQLARVEGLELISEPYQSAVLAPGETNRVYWLVRVRDSLNSGYVYTFPMKIYEGSRLAAEDSFKAGVREKVFSEKYFRQFMQQEEERPYSAYLQLECSADKKSIYLDESAHISCTATNNGPENLKGLRLCFENECSVSSIGAGSSVKLEYEKSFNSLGVKTLVFRAVHPEAEKSYYQIIEIKDKPAAELELLEYPEIISYDQSSEIRFSLKSKSVTVPRELKLKLEHELISQEWSVEKLDQEQVYRFLLKGSHLKTGINDFVLTASYEDEQGREYRIEKRFDIELARPGLGQRIMIWLNIAEHKLRGWLNNL